MHATLALLAALSAECPPYVQTAVGGDYYNGEDARKLPVVENFHFTPQVEMLVRGQSGPLGGDIAYTLDHFPNHPRALAAMARLGLRLRSQQPHGAPRTIECYFERAIGFRPADGEALAVYGAYLLALKRDEEAAQRLNAAVAAQPSNAAAWYNLGLAHMRRKDYPAALEAAHKAAGLGYPLPGLRRQLQAAGKWREPESLDPVVAH